MKPPICEKLGIEFPIFAFSHCRDVVAAVSRAGGFGVLGAARLQPGPSSKSNSRGSASTWTRRPYGVDLAIPMNYLGKGGGDAAVPANLEALIPERALEVRRRPARRARHPRAARGPGGQGGEGGRPQRRPRIPRADRHVAQAPARQDVRQRARPAPGGHHRRVPRRGRAGRRAVRQSAARGEAGRGGCRRHRRAGHRSRAATAARSPRWC
ncbi:hypothetical protein ACU686_31240 [Yinghuangia aomiensis]